MPRLLHLNGPSGIGKSTVARIYADGHPGTLNLEADHVLTLIGGWREDFWGTLASARRLAIAMAETHLRAGHDVVMPQLVTQESEIDRFEEACARVRAEYLEVVLLADRHAAAARHEARSGSDGVDDVEAHVAVQRGIDAVIGENGGPALVDKIYDDLLAHIARRPNCVVVATDAQSPQHTLDAVLRALDDRG